MNSVNDKLDWTAASLGFLYPETIIIIGMLLLIITGLVTKNGYIAKVLSLFISAISVLVLILDGPTDKPLSLFGGMLKLNDFNFFLRVLIGISGMMFLMLDHTKSIIKNHFEYFILSLSVILGAQLLVMSEHFAAVIVSLELMSIPAYVLAGFAFDKASAEASMKYFIYGSVTTAFLIFGVSWIYGLSDTLIFTSGAFAEKLKFNDHELFLGAGLMIIMGLLFKMAATPFHFWAPDVYQSTPMPVLALFSTVPKIAAGALLIRMVSAFGLNGGTRYDWQSIVAGLAIVTLTVGNFSALWQMNVKRLMAYSSIGQAGFLLAAIATMTDSGSKFFLFYGSVLVVSTVLVFLLLDYFESHHQTKSITDFQGLGVEEPALATMLLIGMLSLVGLPITAGFTAKLFLFSGLLEAWSVTGKSVLILLFGFGLLNTVVSLYYYLIIPFYMFRSQPEPHKDSREREKEKQKEKPSVFTLILGAILTVALLWIFFQPDSLMTWINTISFAVK